MFMSSISVPQYQLSHPTQLLDARLIRWVGDEMVEEWYSRNNFVLSKIMGMPSSTCDGDCELRRGPVSLAFLSIAVSKKLLDSPGFASGQSVF